MNILGGLVSHDVARMVQTLVDAGVPQPALVETLGKLADLDPDDHSAADGARQELETLANDAASQLGGLDPAAQASMLQALESLSDSAQFQELRDSLQSLKESQERNAETAQSTMNMVQNMMKDVMTHMSDASLAVAADIDVSATATEAGGADEEVSAESYDAAIAAMAESGETTSADTLDAAVAAMANDIEVVDGEPDGGVVEAERDADGDDDVDDGTELAGD